MQVTVENGEGLARRMIVELPPDDVEKEVEKRLRGLARTMRLPGFRPGKVPMRVLHQRLGEGVRGEVVADMVKSSFPEAVAKEDLRPAATPEFEADINPRARRYAYTARFEALPRIEPVGIASKPIKRPVVDLQETDVDDVIEQIRQQHKTWSEVERPAANGDRVTISYDGSIDGEAFSGGSAENRLLELGSGQMNPDFEQQLIGSMPGAQREIEIAVPDTNPAKHLAGKRVTYRVSVQSIAEPILPEVDADFVRAFDIEDGEMETFRNRVRDDLERQVAQRVAARVKKQVLDALLEVNPIDVPEVLVDQDVKATKTQMIAQMVPGAHGGAVDLPDDLFADQARRRVSLRLLIGEFAARQSLAPDPDRVRAIVEAMAASYEKPAEMVAYYYSDPQRLAPFEWLALEGLVVERLLAEAEVLDESMTLEALRKEAAEA